MFVDETIILVRSGRGGDGCVSFRREKYVPRGGPDGGDGGRGGHVVLRADPQLSTLVDVSRRSVYRAQHGTPGQGSNRHGKRGADLVISVPVGTIARLVGESGEPREGTVLADLAEPGQEVVVARGGRGGRGNKSFATATHQTPREATEGEPADERRLYLELKLLADVGLVGLPNAGKSTLLSRLSAARPKIANYPFTTLQPNLGIADLDEVRRLVFADIPGLIQGAHEGHGLGIEFLRHIERTRVLVHLLSAEERDVDALVASYRTIAGELESFDPALAAKPRLVALSKCDLLTPSESSGLAGRLARALGVEILCLSSVSGQGVAGLLHAVDAMLRAQRERDASADTKA